MASPVRHERSRRLNPTSDEIDALLAGESAASNDELFAALYRYFQPQLSRFARSERASDPDGIADLALFDGYRALATLHKRDQQAFRGYVFRAARSYLARERRGLAPALDGEMDQITESAFAFENDLVDSLAMSDLLDELSPDQRAVIQHRFIDGLTADETGQRLGKNSNAVYQLQHRATRRLRRLALAGLLVVLVAVAAFAALRQAQQWLRDTAPAGEGQVETVDPTPVIPSPVLPGPSPESDTETLPAFPAEESRERSGIVPAPDVAESLVDEADEPPIRTDEQSSADTETGDAPSQTVPPVAVADVLQVRIGEQITLDVLANDQSPTLDLDTVSLISSGADSLALSGRGVLTGTVSQVGVTTVYYRLQNENGDSSIGRVDITVSG
ncbi:MAG: sigma-70 family RNA polymerase sigma factor [Actinomycetota bacterium]